MVSSDFDMSFIVIVLLLRAFIISNLLDILFEDGKLISQLIMLFGV